MDSSLKAWKSILPKGVRSGILEAIRQVESGSGPGLGGEERVGLLWWWPTEWTPTSGFVMEMQSTEVPNLLSGSRGATSGFEIGGDQGQSILYMFEKQAEVCVADYARSAGLPSGAIEDTVWVSGVPNIIFGTWHTHPSGKTEVSPQDLLGERSFETWRTTAGNFPLGAPSSFVLALGTDGVRSVVRFNAHGPMVEWTKSN